MRALAVEQERVFRSRSSSVSSWRTFATVFCGDAIAVAVALMALVAMSPAAGQSARILMTWPLLFSLVFFLCGLYPGVALNPVEEIRKVVTGATAVCLLTAIWTQHAFPFTALAIAGLIATVLIILFREFLRSILYGRPWWGVPTVIIGETLPTRRVAQTLQKHKGLGLRVVGTLRRDAHYDSAIDTAPTLGGFDLTPSLASTHGVRCAILALPGLPTWQVKEIIQGCSEEYERVLVIPEGDGMASMWVDAKDIGGVLGLDLRQSALKRSRNILKRTTDILLGSAVLIFSLPLLSAVYLVIRFTSRGPAFYRGRRIGMDGRTFLIYKFRSMVIDADQRLIDYLAAHPEARSEWARDHKLRNDPRITPVGRFLRKTSLDELPQVWNIIRGDMSFIGPRPIVDEEISRYRDNFLLYKTVRPGLTGLWQISGRNDTSYEQRVKYDEYYVRNWSIWLDLYILGRTAHVVLARRGAY